MSDLGSTLMLEDISGKMFSGSLGGSIEFGRNYMHLRAILT